MAKFNEKKTVKQPESVNFMGEKAFLLKAKEEFVSSIMTTFLSKEGSYYESSNEEVKRILSLLDKIDPLFACKAAIYARENGNMRSISHLLGAALAKHISGQEYAKRFYNKLIVRADDMSEIVSAYANLNGMSLNDLKKIPNSIKKGFKEALEHLDAYQIDKYKMKKRNVTLVDLVRLFHPHATQKNAEAYKRLIEGKSLEGLYTSKVLEKEMTKAGQITKAASEEEKVEAKREAIVSVLDNVKGMPIMNLLRNLRNIILYAPDKVDDACAQLRIQNKIINSRLLPFRFATAYEEIEKMTYSASELKEGASDKITFESDVKTQVVDRATFNSLKAKVLDAIEDALELSCLNIPKLAGKTAILVDDSGSMRGDAGGSSRVSAFSKTTTSMIGHLFATMFAWKQDDVYVGLFGDKLIQVPVKRDMKMLDFNKYSYNLGEKCGGATEAGIYDFFRTVIEDKVKVDNVIIFSDCQIGNRSVFTSWYGTSYADRGGHFHELFKEFRKINPTATVTVCNLRQYGGTSVFDKSQRINNIAGWSTNIFDCIKANSFDGFKEIIKKIEAIEI